MSDSTQPPSAPSAPRNQNTKWPSTFLVITFLPVLLGIIVYKMDSFDPVAYPPEKLTPGEPMVVPKRNGRMLQGAEKIGNGELFAPEDIAYDAKSGVIYTGCADGWIKKVTVKESAAETVVEKWINTGGRPLGLVHGHHGELIIADAYKGLLNATADGKIQVLTDEADGLKFKLTDGVDIAEDGTLYFTDASYKYDYEHFALDLLEGRPHGRLMSYDPSSKQTQVLVQKLYFANGVAVSPDNAFVIFCETPLRRCQRYYLRGERKGSADIFVDNLPGVPDNIMYDGEGTYWIALSTELTTAWKLALGYPVISKLTAIMEKYIGLPRMEKNAGVIAVDLHGNPLAHYYDEKLALTSTGKKIGEYLYCGSIVAPYILRINLDQNPAVPSE